MRGEIVERGVGESKATFGFVTKNDSKIVDL